MVVVLELDVEEGGALMELLKLLELWWFPWRWKRKRMKLSWRSGGGCLGGDEGDGGGES